MKQLLTKRINKRGEEVEFFAVRLGDRWTINLVVDGRDKGTGRIVGGKLVTEKARIPLSDEVREEIEMAMAPLYAADAAAYEPERKRRAKKWERIARLADWQERREQFFRNPCRETWENQKRI